jgi:hypothetical protein
MTPQTPRSYAWALHLEASEIDDESLSEDALWGLELAEILAWNRRERSRDPRRTCRPPQLTLEQLATEQELPVTTTEQLIERARHELFGTLSDAAIAKRVQRLENRDPRTCRHRGCINEIPDAAHGNRRYCPQHSTPKARVDRHRASQRRHTAEPRSRLVSSV